ncbi:hypothetical protein BJV78DRAFT_1280153 [Lactifluus subvellereus]|nr:hypothetical protein BJV78DRAFT_1280153 [Lactifluus subvellereus]
MVRDVSDFLSSSQPGSSQSQCDGPEEMTERAFWQSTPTALQELREGTEKEKEEWHRLGAAREFLSFLAPSRTGGVPVSDHQVGREDLLRLSIEQSRLIPQTWASSTASTVRSQADSETPMRSPAHSRRHAGRGGAGAAGASATTTVTAPMMMCPDNSIFREIKNIEKVCMAVDERIQKRRALKEWTTRVTSETARLRDRDDGADDDDNDVDPEHVPHVERSPSRRRPRNVEAHHVTDVDDRFDDKLGTTQSTQEVPTSQSQERYLSLSFPFLSESQIGPTDCLDARHAQFDDDRVGVTVAGVSPTLDAALPGCL